MADQLPPCGQVFLSSQIFLTCARNGIFQRRVTRRRPSRRAVGLPLTGKEYLTRQEYLTRLVRNI